MNKLTRTAVALAIVLATGITAQAQNKTQHFGGIKDHFKKKYVYDVTFEITKFRGYKYVRGTRGEPLPLDYKIDYTIAAGKQGDSSSFLIRRAKRMQYYTPGRRVTYRGVKADDLLQIGVTGVVAGRTAVAPGPRRFRLNPNGGTVWLNGKDFQIAVRYTVKKRFVWHH